MQTTLKRIATLTAAALLLAASATAKEPIKTEFYGIPFGKSYFAVKTWMAREYENLSTKRDELLYRDMTFAGNSWDYVRMDFDSGRKFYHIGFEKPCSTEESAMSRYALILAMLKEKYGEGGTTDEFGRLSTVFSDNAGHYIYIIVEKGESRGGTVLWYCHLDYYDWKLLKKETDRYKNEL